MEPSCKSDYIDSNREFIVLKVAQRTGTKLVAAAAAAGLVLSPAFATTAAKKRPPAVALSFDPVSSFTPANADPKLAAALSGKSLPLTDFKFTPAAAKNRPSQVRVAIRARTIAPSGVTPGFGGDQRDQPAGPDGLQPRRRRWLEAFRGRRRRRPGQERRRGYRWPRGRDPRCQLLAQQQAEHASRCRRRADIGNPLPALRRSDNVSLDAGASYSLSRRIALTGGVRYNIERERLSALQDQRHDSQAVYVGTAFKF